MAAKKSSNDSGPQKRGQHSDDPHRSGRRWSGNVKTVSTFPPENTFNQDAESIARIMATKKVSPKGIGSGIRMVQFYINRAGKNLPAKQRKELEKAKHILQERNREEKAKEKRKSKSSRKK